MQEEAGLSQKISQKKYIRSILSLLKDSYPNASIALTYSTPWELLVAVILSAQCTDKMVNRVTERLFRKYKTVDDYLHADIREFEQDIRQTGFYRNKAKHILQTARILHDVWHNQVPHTMKELITLPGVARKTANVVLSNAFGKIEGIAVDTHVLRISQRLRFVDMATIGGKKTVYVGERGERVDYKKDADPNKIEAQLMRVIDKSDWHRITYMIIDHGRAVCKAQNPKCKECSLNVLCPSSRIHT